MSEPLYGGGRLERSSFAAGQRPLTASDQTTLLFSAIVAVVTKVVLAHMEQRGIVVPKAGESGCLLCRRHLKVGDNPALPSVLAGRGEQAIPGLRRRRQETIVTGPPAEHAFPLDLDRLPSAGGAGTPVMRSRGHLPGPLRHSAAASKPAIDIDAALRPVIGTPNQAKIRTLLERYVVSNIVKTQAEANELAKFLALEAPKVKTSGSWRFKSCTVENAAALQQKVFDGDIKHGLDRDQQLKRLAFIESLIEGESGVFGTQYSWDEVRAICGDNIKVSGDGGHGNVFYVKGTPYAIKQNMQEEKAQWEYEAYKDFAKLNARVVELHDKSDRNIATAIKQLETAYARELDNARVMLGRAEAAHDGLNKASSQERTQAEKDLESAKAACAQANEAAHAAEFELAAWRLRQLRNDPSNAMGTSASYHGAISVNHAVNGGQVTNKYVIMRNALWTPDGEQIALPKSDENSDRETDNLFDHKIGKKWSMSCVLMAEGSVETGGGASGKLSRFWKRVKVQHIQEPDRAVGYTLIAKKGVKIDGQKMSAGASSSVSETDGVLKQRTRYLTNAQLDGLIAQLEYMHKETQVLPFAFVGSSIMLAFPEISDTTKMPQAMAIDFAHPSKLDKNINSRDIPDYSKHLAKGKDNYVDGVFDLLGALRKLRNAEERRGLGTGQRLASPRPAVAPAVVRVESL